LFFAGYKLFGGRNNGFPKVDVNHEAAEALKINKSQKKTEKHGYQT
jgi:hypothetical protein